MPMPQYFAASLLSRRRFIAQAPGGYERAPQVAQASLEFSALEGPKGLTFSNWDTGGNKTRHEKESVVVTTALPLDIYKQIETRAAVGQTNG